MIGNGGVWIRVENGSSLRGKIQDVASSGSWVSNPSGSHELATDNDCLA